MHILNACFLQNAENASVEVENYTQSESVYEPLTTAILA